MYGNCDRRAGAAESRIPPEIPLRQPQLGKSLDVAAERSALIEESAEPAEAPPDERNLSGMESWFATADGMVVRPPARWKMWLLSTGGIYPIIAGLTVLVGPLAELPAPARLAIIVPVLSAAMTWVVMPALSRLFAQLHT